MEPAETHPDKLVDFWEWLVEHRTQVILAIVIALGAGMIWYVKKVSAAQDEEAANDELLTATNPTFTMDDTDTNLTKVARLRKVATDNPGTAAAVNATFLAASQLFDDRSYVEAEKAFQDFVVNHPDHPLAASAQFGAAVSRESARPSAPTEAVAGYEKVIAQFANSPEAMQARVALAKLYLRQTPPDKAKALQLITNVTDDAQTTLVPGFWRGEAMRLRDTLEPQPEPELGPEEKK